MVRPVPEAVVSRREVELACGVRRRVAMKQAAWLTLAVAVGVSATVSGCGDAPAVDHEASGPFIASADDEMVDASDPPTDPDPLDEDDVDFATSGLSVQGGGAAPAGGASPKCLKRQALSPKGLTFVLHISKNKENAERNFNHLKALRRYVRARDIFMVEERSPVLERLHEVFPCNRFHYIAYPDEMQKALATGNLIDGIAVDWEGGHVESHSQAWSVDRLSDYVRAIRKAGKQPSFVPSWSSRFDDAAVTRASNMDYELAQIQGGCVRSALAFGLAAKRLLHDFRDRDLGVRNIGFEISMSSYDVADNHVGPARSADCTRAAYGKGARAIYLYGNGHDELPDYFHALGRMGVRTKR
jgi:hypothetical protein